MMGEHEDSDVHKEQVKYLVGLIRGKLQALSTKEISDEYVLRNFFNDADTNKSGDISIDELHALMAKIGVSCERKYIKSLMDLFDTNRNGVIEFEEFVNFVIHNPYK